MRQQGFAADDFEKYLKKTRKEVFLEGMDRIILWKALSEVINLYRPKPKGAGRRPVGIERMLRIHFLHHWFELSDPGTEEALRRMPGRKIGCMNRSRMQKTSHRRRAVVTANRPRLNN